MAQFAEQLGMNKVLVLNYLRYDQDNSIAFIVYLFMFYVGFMGIKGTLDGSHEGIMILSFD